MTIAWKYFDKNDAAIAAMQDYENMRFIVNNTPNEIKEAYEEMAALRSPKLTRMPSANNPKAGEERIAEQLDDLDFLRDRYRSAAEYMAWFEPVWETLGDAEKCVLREYYMTGNQKSGAAARVECELGYCDRQIRRIKERALERFSILLFGK